MLRGVLTSLDAGDRWLVVPVICLCLLGTLIVFVAGSYQPEAMHGSWGHMHFLMKHLARLGLGLCVMLSLASLDYHVFRRAELIWTLLVVSLGLTALAVILGGGRWLPRLLGLFPIQPVEIAKIALVLFLARQFSRTGVRSVRDPRYLGQNLVPALALVGILILQPNYGSALVVCLVTLILMFASGVSLRLLGAGLGGLVLAAFVAFEAVGKIHYRVTAWWHSIWDVDAAPYQVLQSLIGFGAGGPMGRGIGDSHQRFWFLPESHTDFVYAVIGEEMGLWGTLATLVLFAVFAWRGLAIAGRASDPFGRLAAIGLSSMIFIYVAANMTMVLGVMPVMGLPLPFISYGGSALVTNLAAVGLLLSIDRYGRSYQEARTRWHRR